MASQYSHLQFFRRAPNSQLAAYFAFKAIDLGIDLSDLKGKFMGSRLSLLFISF